MVNILMKPTRARIQTIAKHVLWDNPQHGQCRTTPTIAKLVIVVWRGSTKTKQDGKPAKYAWLVNTSMRLVHILAKIATWENMAMKRNATTVAFQSTIASLVHKVRTVKIARRVLCTVANIVLLADTVRVKALLTKVNVLNVRVVGIQMFLASRTLVIVWIVKLVFFHNRKNQPPAFYVCRAVTTQSLVKRHATNVKAVIFQRIVLN